MGQVQIWIRIHGKSYGSGSGFATLIMTRVWERILRNVEPSKGKIIAQLKPKRNLQNYVFVSGSDYLLLHLGFKL